MEGKMHFNKVVGKNKAERDIVTQELQNVFNQENEVWKKYEIKKTPEDIEMIEKVESIVDSIVASYGGDSKPLPLDNIYIFPPGLIQEKSDGKISGGIHQPYSGKIGVEKEKSNLLFASIFSHELLHFKSYKSARVGDGVEDIRLYRTGLSLIDRKDITQADGQEKVYFRELEEAIVAECSKKVFSEIRQDSLFVKETQAIEQIKTWLIEFYKSHHINENEVREKLSEIKYIYNAPEKVRQIFAYSDVETERQEYTEGFFRAMYEKNEIIEFEGYDERKKMYDLLERILQNSKGQFSNRNQVFDEFAKANFSGNYISLARIVENTLGEGSFRKLAEEFSQQS